MPVPEAFYLWLISEVVGPQLADRAVGQLRSGWERRLAREAIAVSGVKVSRRRIEKWLKSEDVWNRLVRLQPADIAAMHRSLSAVVALSRGYRGASSQKVGESTQQMLDAVVGQFLALLEPSRALNVAHYREMWELKKLGRDVAEMRTILEDQTQRSDYLAVPPAPTARALERAAEVQPVPAAHLAAYLTQGTRSPAAIVHELWSEPPPWLTDGSHWLLLALAEFAASHGVNSTAAEIFEAMAEGGAPDRPRWLARAALSASGTGDQDRANRLAERARAFGGDSHSFVDFAAALISDDAESVMAAVTDELLEEKQDAAMALLAKARAEDLLGRRDDAIATLEGLTAERPDFTSALLTQARFLVNRAVTEGSDSRYADVTRAKDLSLAA
ncbi:MAG: hypothetical protein Q8Q52_05740, partial [Acidimicrobiia bacterium]|nr:hypothetical protein [Acidimicrobiia bacterium]